MGATLRIRRTRCVFEPAASCESRQTPSREIGPLQRLSPTFGLRTGFRLDQRAARGDGVHRSTVDVIAARMWAIASRGSKKPKVPRSIYRARRSGSFLSRT